MFFKALFILFLITSTLYSFELSRDYFIPSKDVNLSTLLPHVEEDKTLFKISEDRYSIRVSAKQLIKLLKKYGVTQVTTHYPYIQFTKKSPIDTTNIKNTIISKYKQTYKNIIIDNVEVHPRSYISTLPLVYETELRSRDTLNSHGIIYIKTEDKKKIFFNYKIEAHLSVYETTTKIKRNEKLSFYNLKKVNIKLQRFRALPLQEFKKNSFEAKHNINKNKVVTINDIKGLTLVHRGNMLNIYFKDGNIEVFFSAKALKDGKLNDIIPVKTINKKKLHVKIVGEKRATLK